MSIILLSITVVRGYLDTLDILQNITVIYYIDDVILIEFYEHDMTSMLEDLVRHLHSRGWDINPLKIQEPTFSKTI